MRDFLEEYCAGAPDLMAFYAAPPEALWEAKPSPSPWDPALVDAIRAYQSNLLMPSWCSAIPGGGETQFRGDEAVIATGQQAGLFTGPLYTIYKAITAIGLAERLQERSGTPCVPLFWVASDDHDFEEARTAHFLTKSHEPLALAYEPQTDIADRPMYRVPLDESVHALIDRAAAETRGSEHRAEIARFLHESADASDSLADWTARLLKRLFRDTPLIVFVPHLPAARRCAAEVFEKEIRDPLASGSFLNAAGQPLRELGFHQQIVKGDGECCFFVEVEGRRCKVTFEHDRYHLACAELVLGVPRLPEDLIALLHSSPERFSPNVALRCIVQQHFFPVAAYVAGPGELAYWAQLKPLFERFGKTMPVVYPRARGMLTTAKLGQLMGKLGLTMADLSGPPDRVVEKALKLAGNNSLPTELVYERREEIEAALEALAHELREKEPTGAAIAGKILERLKTDFDRLERTLAYSDSAQVETVRKQVSRLCNTLTPFRKPQERVYTIFSFLFEHGWDLIPRLIKEIDIESFSMQEIEL